MHRHSNLPVPATLVLATASRGQHRGVSTLLDCFSRAHCIGRVNPMPSYLPISISIAVYNLQCHQRPVALIPCCGRLKIPWVGKCVGSGFLSTNCRLMVKTRQFRLIHDRQHKSSREKKEGKNLKSSTVGNLVGIPHITYRLSPDSLLMQGFVWWEII